MSGSFYTLKWEGDAISFIDQRLLPLEERYVRCSTCREVADAIKTMVVRGAPAIGISASYGIALGLLNCQHKDIELLERDFRQICDVMYSTRPTAVNLFWAIDRMKKSFYEIKGKATNVDEIVDHMIGVASTMYEEDIEINKAIGLNGRDVTYDGMNVLTHCNAGALATAGYGTALGVIRSAHEEGKKMHVYVDETRPFLQGARLTMWELMKDGIDCTLLCDSMSASLMAKKEVDVVIVGADRIAANGDSANKIGTYSLAVLARYHDIPIYFAAPMSTVDINCPNGSRIPIEERSPDEVKEVNGSYICPKEAKAINPAFDVTPNSLITGIITEKGIINPPFDVGIKSLFKGGVV